MPGRVVAEEPFVCAEPHQAVPRLGYGVSHGGAHRGVHPDVEHAVAPGVVSVDAVVVAYPEKAARVGLQHVKVAVVQLHLAAAEGAARQPVGREREQALVEAGNVDVAPFVGGDALDVAASDVLVGYPARRAGARVQQAHAVVVVSAHPHLATAHGHDGAYTLAVQPAVGHLAAMRKLEETVALLPHVQVAVAGGAHGEHVAAVVAVDTVHADIAEGLLPLRDEEQSATVEANPGVAVLIAAEGPRL